MSSVTLSNLAYELHEYWLTHGVPKETYGPAGTLFKMVEKCVGGWVGTGVGKLPMKTGLNGNVGNNADKVFADSTPSSGEQFQPIAARHWANLTMSDRLLAFGSADASESDQTALLSMMESTASAWYRSTSYLLWGDGRQLLGKGDGAYSVAGPTITFKNSNSKHRFERGDKIRLVDVTEAGNVGPGVLPLARAGTLTIIAVGKGSITLDNTVDTIVGATNLDFVTKDVYFDAAGQDIHPFTGVFGFLGQNETDANSTLYGVDRSVDVCRLSGHRIKLVGGESPYTIFAMIMEEAVNTGAQVDTVFVPGTEVAALLEDLGNKQIQYLPNTYQRQQGNDIVIGVSGYDVQWGDIRARIVADRFLSDPTVAAADDHRYVALNSEAIQISCNDMPGWRNYAAGEVLRRSESGTRYSGQFGIFGQYQCDNTNDAIVAGPATDA